jgi:hypothetical protein
MGHGLTHMSHRSFCVCLCLSANTQFWRNGAVLIQHGAAYGPAGNNLYVGAAGLIAVDIDELRLWCAYGPVLTATEIANGYTFNMWTSTNLAVYYPMADQAGTTITDMSGNVRHMTGQPFGSTFTWRSANAVCSTACAGPGTSKADMNTSVTQSVDFAVSLRCV